MTRFVVCGEALIDLVPGGEHPGGHFSTNWMALSAGGPMNTAVALGQLGCDTQFLGRMSTDSFGVQLRGHIADNGVGLDLATESDQSTSIAVVSLDEAGVASYTFHFADTANFGWQPADLPVLTGEDWLHIASLACVVPPGDEVLLAWTGQTAAGLSFDINVRPTVISDPVVYWSKVEPWFRVVGQKGGVLKASDVDVAFLAQASSAGEDPVDVLAGWVERYGLRAGVVTLGADGAVAVTGDGDRVRVPGVPVTVLDTVGAGDTFMAGFLDGYVERQLSPEESLRRGAVAAAIVCGRRGAQPPTASEVDALITPFEPV